MTDAAPTVYQVSDFGLDYLADKFAKYEKRALKIGVPAPTFEVIGTVEKRDDLGLVEVLHQVVVHGAVPKYDGWRLVAVIDRDLENPTEPNVVKAVPGAATDPSWRFLADVCDHCGHVPRGRKSLVAVRHDAHGDRIVGLTCLKAFLGDTSPDTIARWAEVIAGLGDVAETAEGWGVGAGERRVDPVRYLAKVIVAVDKYGWVSRSASREGIATATADRAWNDFSARHDMVVLPITDDALDWAEKALDWAADLPLEPRNRDGSFNDYLANVRAVAGKTAWRFRDVGIGASIVSAYRREVERAARVARDAAVVKVPAPEGRVEVTGTVIATDTREGYRPDDVREVMTVEVACGDGVWRGWLTVPAALSPVEVGEKVRLTATWKRSDRDEAFAFGSRPSKAVKVGV